MTTTLDKDLIDNMASEHSRALIEADRTQVALSTLAMGNAHKALERVIERLAITGLPLTDRTPFIHTIREGFEQLDEPRVVRFYYRQTHRNKTDYYSLMKLCGGNPSPFCDPDSPVKLETQNIYNLEPMACATLVEIVGFAKVEVDILCVLPNAVLRALEKQGIIKRCPSVDDFSISCPTS